MSWEAIKHRLALVLFALVLALGAAIVTAAVVGFAALAVLFWLRWWA